MMETFESITKQVSNLTEHLLIGLSPFFDSLSSALSIYFFMTMLIISSTFFMGWAIEAVWLAKNEPRTRNFPPALQPSPKPIRNYAIGWGTSIVTVTFVVVVAVPVVVGECFERNVVIRAAKQQASAA